MVDDVVETYSGKLIQLKESPDWKEIQLSTVTSPWEWGKGSTNFVPISSASDKKIKETNKRNFFM